MHSNILPDSRLKVTKNAQWRAGAWWIPVFCAHCGAEHGLVPEDSTHAFFLCDGCAEKMGPIAGTYMVPDEVFYQTLVDAQQEKYGRQLSPLELLAQLDDVNSFISTLARSRAALTPAASA